MTTYIILTIIAVLIIWAIAAYNRFVTLAARVQEAWSDIDVQLKRRYDLIPNLVATVKGYANHEAGTLEKVTEMRTRAMNATTLSVLVVVVFLFFGALKSLFAVSENYPNLKANENFVALQNELSDTENKIQAARRFYNGVVMDLNTKLGSFPSNIIGSTYGFQKRDFFQLGADEQAAKEPVKVQF